MKEKLEYPFTYLFVIFNKFNNACSSKVKMKKKMLIHDVKALRLSASLEDFLQMPYDYFCPTVKLRLSSRTYKTCGFHRASVKSLNRHIEKIHKKVNTHTDRKVRPVRVAASRANELMCIIQNLEHHDVEWLDKNDVDILKSDKSEQIHNTEQQSKQSNVIENLESWIQVSWTEDC
ncbi:hypothetical protein O3G_MSEX006916 [Manduca sexta]|uniref:Uncharacterized protein n=1 Tax=Manduca sexta TaxID=7130 RepID=A0A921Z536_MANSE|nr:hypothetical protein O3G_MSEX006916 [Manduca sexta]